MRVALAGALALNVLLALARAPAPTLTVFPLAPPLTRLASLGDAPLDPEARPPPPAAELLRRLGPLIAPHGSPAQRALMERARAAEGRAAPLLHRSMALRVAVERDAQALALALGPARVEAFVAAREALSARWGETRTWQALAEDLRP